MQQSGISSATPGSFDVVVIGCGAIGLALGVAFASRGLNIALCDSDPHRRQQLAVEKPAFGDADMVESMLQAIAAQRLHVLDKPRHQSATTHYIICVPTPVNAHGDLDDSALNRALASIMDVARPDDAVFIRSTVPIGLTRRLDATARARGFDLRFASTPDRSIEGRSYTDQFSIPQLIGGVDKNAAGRAAHLFAHLGPSIDLGSAEAAEAAKLFANVWRAALFATSNAMAMACETHGLDVYAIYAAAGTNYPRFSPPRPGPVGGPCLPKDARMLSASLPVGAGALFHAVTQTETDLITQIITALEAHLVNQNQPLRIAFAGIAFKGRPAVDDARGSSAVALARHFHSRWPQAILIGWDPVMTIDQIEEAEFIPAGSVWDAAANANLLVFCNDHPALANIDLETIALSLCQGALIYDISGVTIPLHRTFPNDVRHHILGRGKVTKIHS